VSLATAEALGLPLLDQEGITLADDSVIAVSRFEGTVLWDGHERTVMVHCLEGDSLIGMSLIHAHLLTMEVVGGGQVTIAAL
jgi:predicted aspartyl protease